MLHSHIVCISFLFYMMPHNGRQSEIGTIVKQLR